MAKSKLADFLPPKPKPKAPDSIAVNLRFKPEAKQMLEELSDELKLRPGEVLQALVRREHGDTFE